MRGTPPSESRLRLSPTASAEPARRSSASSAGDTISLGEISLGGLGVDASTSARGTSEERGGDGSTRGAGEAGEAGEGEGGAGEEGEAAAARERARSAAGGAGEAGAARVAAAAGEGEGEAGEGGASEGEREGGCDGQPGTIEVWHVLV